ncbi:MAG: twin-arginine translocation signal domain-containing protein, partial [Bryobacteraceae bacterium]
METNSRRSFLQLAATLGALAPAAAKAAVEPAAPPLPTVKFGKFDISRMIVGSNPLYGYSHF